MSSDQDARVINVTVPGEPVGKGRPRATVMGWYRGSYKRPDVRLYTPKKTADYEAMVEAEARRVMATEGPPLEGPLCVSLMAIWAYRKSERKAIVESELLIWKPTKPDGDNVLKAVLDAVEGPVYANDGQVVDARVRCFWGPSAGIVLQVWRAPAIP